MHSHRVLLSAAAALVLGSAAHADTVATFADPGTSAAPLFNISGNTLTGGWAGTGLTLQTPGTPAPDYSDVTFVMSPLALVPLFGGFFATSGGTINFFDGANPILTITFASGFLTSPTGVGASDFASQMVTFSGPALGALIPSNEAFAFSFANLNPTQTGYTATSAFTSSANLDVPGPASLAGLGVGLLVAARRRRA